MLFVILRVSNEMGRKPCLPDVKIQVQLLFCAIGESTLDELKRFFQRDLGKGREEQVKVVRHDDEFMQEKAALSTIVLEDVDQQLRHAPRL